MISATHFTERVLRDRRLQNIGLCLLMLVLAGFLTAFSERIPVGDGLGYDGSEYGQWAMHFDKVLRHEIPVTPYRVVRILPSALAWGVLTLTGAAKTPDNVIRFFQIANVVLLALSALAWGGIADAVGLRPRGKLLGFLGLFANYLVLKYAFYYPVLTDVFGYAGALGILWAYLRNRTGWLCAATLAGSFAWPTLCVYGGLLLLFPRREVPAAGASSLAARLAVLSVAGVYLFYATRVAGQPAPYHALSVVVVCAYLAGGAWLLFSDARYLSPANLLRATTWPRLGVLAAGISLYLLGKALFGPPSTAGGGGNFFQLSTLQMIEFYVRGICVPLSTRFPGEFLVAHILYFGPLLLLTACFPRQTAEAAGRFGFGFLLCLTAAGLHAIMPLSRQGLAGYPFMVLATTLALERFALSRAFLAWFAVLSLVVSKVWLAVNIEGAPGVSGSTHDKAFAWVPGFSFDRYISSTGRWMPAEWYAAQGAILLGVFVLYYWYFHAPRARLTDADANTGDQP